ncbi:hypothetical protein F5Y10DRAFT_256157 [Nemania abortiva]|nr:hypothetical protein F5Y10DRAFT_256157 [Nemania abortiva]
MASERIGSRLARNILNIEAFKCSVTEQFNWVECLRSIGADPRLPHPTSSKFDDILVERSLEWEEFRTVNLLLETNSLSKRYLTRLVLRCVEEDDLLDCTKTLLEKACTKSAELWIEAYSHMVYSYDNSYNFHTLWYLVEFLGELIQSGIEININRRPSYAPGMRRETEHYGETLVEYCLQKTVRCYPSCDWVRPLFHIGLDVTKLSKAGRDMYQECKWHVYLFLSLALF